jgi:hypothetical protein
MLRLRYKYQPLNAILRKINVDCETHMKHMNSLSGQNAKFYYVKMCGTHKTTGL